MLLLVCLFNFVNIFMRAFQQQNVINGNYLWVIPCSLVMGGVELYTIDFVATKGFSILVWLLYSLAGGIGCMASMYLHKRYLTK